jgi:uncharacterized repeat protein (TIGR01451 family)
MKSFLYHIKSLNRTLTPGDMASSQTIAAIWQRKQKTTIPSWLGIGMSCLFAVTIAPGQAMADPASNAPNFSQTSAGAISTSTTVPDGVCAVAATVVGGGGGASTAGTVVTGGTGGAGAVINARFRVLPSQVVTGAIGAGGNGNGGTPPSLGGSGTALGGNGGTVGGVHPGGGGGGSSSISVAGLKLIEAGGGGGGGAAHDNAAGLGGNAGFSGIAPGVVALGSNGQAGVDSPGTSGGGSGGQLAAGGAGGSNTGGPAVNGSPGGGIGSGNGGNGGPDSNNDSGGGGGGGYTGGGGGASTLTSTVTGGGGGGGSSYIRGTSPTALASVPTNVPGVAGTRSTGTTNGATGKVTLDWVPCVYSLGITKKASAATVKAGDKVIWTVTVTNNGPDPMTRGDTITLSDTLPTTGISSSTPKFKVLSLTTTSGGSTDSNLDSGPMTCTGVTVGQAMPTASTVCSRPYSSASSPGVTANGTRGLNSGETLTLTYEEIFANKTAAATITNTASTKDRSSAIGTTDIVGVTTTPSVSDSTIIQPYDLKVVKSVSSTTATPGATLTWTVDVTNLGSADMEGPAETATNPLIVTDVAPTTNVSAPTSFTSTGLAGACTYASGTITCPKGLPAGQTQTFTFQQTVNANAPSKATIPNTATVSDYVTGDSNDSSTVVSTTIAVPLACGTIYGSYNNGSIFNSLRAYNPTGSVGTQIATLSTGVTNVTVAALAVDPVLDNNSNRRVYYMDNTGTNARLFYYDGTSNVNTGITLTVSYSPITIVRSDGSSGSLTNTFNRMGFAPDGTLYIADGQKTFYRFSPDRSSTGGTLSSAITIVDNLNNDSGNSGRAQVGQSGGGDIAFDNAGRMYIVTYDSDSSNVPTEFRLFQIFNPTSASPAAVLLGRYPSTDTVAGLAFQASDNKLYMQGSGGKSFSWNLATNTVGILTTVSPGSADLGSCTYPDLNPTGTFAKSVANITNPSATVPSANDVLEYTLSVTNNGTLVAGNVTLVDAIPTGTTYVAKSTKLNGAAQPDNAGAMPYANTANPKQVNSPGQASGVLAAGASNKATVVFQVTVNAANTQVCNQGNVKYDGISGSFPAGIFSDDPTTTTIADDQTCTAPVSSNPNVLLVKRITAVNGSTTNGNVALNTYDPDPTYPYDKNVIQSGITPPTTDKWPNTSGNPLSSTFLLGARDGGVTKPGDEVEYTIYFLSAGTGTAKAVQLCDRIPSHQTFVPNAFNGLTVAPNTTPVLPIGDRGIEVSQGGTNYGYTNIGDGDAARYYPPGSLLPSACTQPALAEDNGTVVVDLGDVPNATAPGIPVESYGFFRFRTKTK